MARIALSTLTPWITAAALLHPAGLPDHLAQRLGVSRRSALGLLRKLIAAQWLVREGPPRRVVYRPGLLRQVVCTYGLAELQEDLPWRRDFAPFFALPDNVARIAEHAFTELLNNAIDHSGGSGVTVSMRQTPAQLQLLVSDDGCGLFQRLGECFGLTDAHLAMHELGKGKLTSQPDRHSGRGLYFTARLADVLDLHANAAAFQHRGWQPNQWHPGRPAAQRGTSVYVGIAIDTARELDSVLREHSLDGQGYGFERTVVPLRLLGRDGGGLESRAQAKRVGARLDQFRRAELDFDGVDVVGHAFADELFRVFANAHPGVELAARNMNARVAALVRSIQPMRSAR